MSAVVEVGAGRMEQNKPRSGDPRTMNEAIERLREAVRNLGSDIWAVRYQLLLWVLAVWLVVVTVALIAAWAT